MLEKAASEGPAISSQPGSQHGILIVSYMFPPCGGVGVLRALSYAKYLPATGCQVSVLTARNPVTAVYDPGLLDQVPPGVAVYRSFTPELPYSLRNRLWRRISTPPPSAETPASASVPRGSSPVRSLQSALNRAVQRIICPDPQVVWSPFAIRRACRIIRRHEIKTVLVNAPPFSLLRIGVAVKRRFPDVRLITDFRDEWVGYHLPAFDTSASQYKRRAAVALEGEAVRCSDWVIAVTAAQRDRLRSRYPDQPDGKFLCIPNGYDPEVFREFRPRPHKESRMVVAYLGTVYENACYSPRPYLDALDELPEEIRAAVETRFIGRVTPEAAPGLEGRRSLVRQWGFLPQQQALQQLEEADCLLLIVADSTAHGGKLFEYLATGKPILALSPADGEAGRLIREAAAGWCVDPRDKAGIQSALIEALEWFRGRAGKQLQPNRAVIRAYERPALVARLVGATGMVAAAGGTARAPGDSRRY